MKIDLNKRIDNYFKTTMFGFDCLETGFNFGLLLGLTFLYIIISFPFFVIGKIFSQKAIRNKRKVLKNE